ncbi:MAG: radical SAM family heme chaperone HemW [Chlorobi bacterium]|nr:radical SAM family heme chaperone HemW [Chlorobiota bacterium]
MSNFETGLYIHIPFCRRKCPYCDFYITTNTKWIVQYCSALLNELAYLRHRFNPVFKTIYLGGGTPSFLPISCLETLFSFITKTFAINDSAEWTIEVNPEDVNAELISFLKNSPINRISLGIQSFRDRDLRFLGRAHTSKQAFLTVERLKPIIPNISVDIIYGLPEQSPNDIVQTLETLKTLEIPHFSAYLLTIEERTLFGVMATQGSLSINEDKQAELFMVLREESKNRGYMQYEISNFALDEKFFSKHNLLYWLNDNVLNVGAGAHGSWTRHYKRVMRWRRINRRNIYLWLEAYLHKRIPNATVSYEFPLSTKEFFNEMVLNGLRTMWGINIIQLKKTFPEKFVLNLLEQAGEFLDSGLLLLENGYLRVTESGKLLTDHIASSLMIA